MKIKVKLDSHSEIGSFRTFSTLLPFISTRIDSHNKRSGRLGRTTEAEVAFSLLFSFIKLA